MNAIQRQVWALDKDQPVTNVRTMEEIISESAAQNRFEVALLIAFAGVAVLLTTIGLFGVLSYLVSQRKAELGIRMALGASPGRIVMLVLRQAVAWIAAGVALGGGRARADAVYRSSSISGEDRRPLDLLGRHTFFGSGLPCIRPHSGNEGIARGPGYGA